MLTSVFGDGNTVQEAIANYAKEISGKLIVIDAYSRARREIKVPTLIDA